MPKYTVFWEWEEAFDKFGFNDGDGMVFTGLVADFIDSLGYESSFDGGMHNSYFNSIKDKSGKNLLSDEVVGDEIDVGYDDPRKYLPESLVQKLDEHFDDDYVSIEGE